MKLLKSIRVLDPLFFKLNDVDLNEQIVDFPELKDCLDEMVKYKLLCDGLRESIDINDFWIINKTHLPKLYNLAKVFLHFPISTASVERSFSKYNNLLTTDRQRLKPETLRSLIFLYYNKNINANEILSENEEEEDIQALQLEEENSMSGIVEL